MSYEKDVSCVSCILSKSMLVSFKNKDVQIRYSALFSLLFCLWNSHDFLKFNDLWACLPLKCHSVDIIYADRRESLIGVGNSPS